MIACAQKGHYIDKACIWNSATACLFFFLVDFHDPHFSADTGAVPGWAGSSLSICAVVVAQKTSVIADKATYRVRVN